MNWSDYFEYDVESKSKLTWCTNLFTGSHGQICVAQRGEPSGSWCKSTGYYQVSLNGTNYLCHRIIYELEFDKIPVGYEIDHKDGNRENNLKENLRAVPVCVNRRNSKLSKRNTSGVIGVTLCNGRRWSAVWNTLEGKSKMKSFSIKRFGYENAFIMACEYRKAIIDAMNKEGAGYTDRHGIS